MVSTDSTGKAAMGSRGSQGNHSRQLKPSSVMMNAGSKRLDSRSKDPANFTQNLGKTSMSQT